MSEYKPTYNTDTSRKVVYAFASVMYVAVSGNAEVPAVLQERIERLNPKEVDRFIEGVLSTLAFREKHVIALRYGFHGKGTYTLKEVAQIFHTTPERVREIEAKAMKKLQHPIRRDAIRRTLENLLRE